MGYQTWPFAIPVVVAIVTLAVGIFQSRSTLPWPFAGWIFFLGLAVVPLGTYFAWTVRPAYGLAYALATYSPALFISLSMCGKLSRRIENWTIISALVVATTMTVWVIPTAVIPFYRGSAALVEMASEVQEELDVAFVGESLTRITTSMSAAAANIETEQRTVKTAIDRLLVNLRQRNEVLRDLSVQQQQLLREVEQYKTLASISEEQASAVRAALARGKYVDYLIGFLLGLASSAVVTFGFRFGVRQRARKANVV